MGLDKQYVLAQQQAADPEDHKSSVDVATTGSLPAYARVDNVITASAPGALPSIDGEPLSVDDSLLLWHGADGEDNGIYLVTQLGDGGTPFILTRRPDADRDEYVTAGMTFRVMKGSVYGGGSGTLFVLQTPDPIVLNTTELTFGAEVSGGGPTEFMGINLDVSPITQGMAVMMAYGGPPYGVLPSTTWGPSQIDVNGLGFVNEPLIAPAAPGRIIYKGTVIIPTALQQPAPTFDVGDVIFLSFLPGTLRNVHPLATVPPDPNGQWQIEVGTIISLAGPPGSDAEMLINVKLPIKTEPTP
jgi:hypothetical protein